MGNKVPSMKKGDISKITSTANVEPDKVTIALGRTLLVRKLNTGRCTTPQELKERFDNLFEICFKNQFCPTVEMLAIAARLG